MELIMGICPSCGNVMSMPNDSEIVRCPTCSAEVSMVEAAVKAGTAGQVNLSGTYGAQQAPQPEAPAQPDPAQQPDTASEAGIQEQPVVAPANPKDPWAGAAAAAGPGAQAQAGPAAQAHTQSASPYDEPPLPTPSQADPGLPVYTNRDAPFLSSWKTNALYTALGILAYVVFYTFFTSASDESTLLSGAMGILMLGYLVFCIVYAAKLYPSYFTDKPALSSPEAVNFLNGLVGGIIFGLLWNHNLTRKDKGVSHIVFIVLLAVSFFSIFLLLAMIVVFGVAALA